LEEQLVEVKAKLEAKLKESLALTAVSSSTSSSSSGGAFSGMSATGGSDMMEVSGGSGLRSNGRLLRNSAPAGATGIAAAAAAHAEATFDHTVAASELVQYKTLFEATLEENNRLGTKLRESSMVEQLLRNELHQKDEKVRELQQMEGVFQEQVC